MTIESASSFLVGSIMYTIGIVVIIAGATFINTILSKYWKPVKIWMPHYFQEPQRFATEEEISRITPTMEKEKPHK
jgi:hypothetical protein